MSASRWSPLLLAALALSPAANAQTTFDTYRLSRLLEDEVGIVFINDINEEREIAGAIQFATTRGILLRDGMVVEIGDLMGGASRLGFPTALNDHTQVTGWTVVLNASGNEVVRAFLWEAGQIRDLGIDSDAFPNDINNRGQVVGLVRSPSGGEQPFLWRDGQTTFLELLPSPMTPGGFATAINESGVIVGRSTSAVGPRAVTWRDGEVMVLEPTFPHDSGLALDVNDQGDVIGIYSNVCGPVFQTAFLWREDGVTELATLGLPGGDSPTPLSINNKGQIVGTTLVFTNAVQILATLWQEGAIVDLNTLISDDDPLKPFVTLLRATKITDSGLIIAQGKDSREENAGFYLLTPTGAPCTAPVLSPSPADTLPSPSDTAPSSSDTGRGGGAVDLLSLLFLILGLSSFARSQRLSRARPFG